MNFLQPLFLAGLLAAALPLLVHLFNRRKAVRRPFPAMAYLLESNKRTARSVKVRQWVLMALRVLAIVMLAFALAKPFVLSERGVTAGERMPTAVVVVVDTSASMRAQGWWDEAEDLLDDELGRLRPWDEVALIDASALDDAPSRLTDEHARVREAAGKLEPTGRAVDLGAGIQTAGALLAASQLPNRKIVVISDFSGDPGAPSAPPNAVVELRGVRGEADAPVNVGVVDVVYAQEGAGAQTQWRVESTLENFSDQPARDVVVHLHIDGARVASGRVEEIPARGRAAHVFRHELDGVGVRAARVEAKADGDVYAPDDDFHFTMRLKSRVRALLVNGEPASIPYDDELFFLTRALNPHRRDDGIIPTAVLPDALGATDLEPYDVIVLANVPRVGGAAAAKLEAYVRGGGGLMIAMGDQIDVDAYNQTLGAILPKPLRGLKRLARRDDPDAPVKITRVGASNPQHPVFRAFNMPGGSTLQSAEIYSYMLLEPSASGEAQTLLSFKDSAPAIIERPLDDGRVLLVTTSLDFEWSDLPIRAGFLPLMQRAAMYLARRATSKQDARSLTGEPTRLDVGGMARQRVIVRAPGATADAQPTRVVLEPVDGVVSLTPARPGFHAVFADEEDDADDSRARLDDLAFAANVPRSESALAAAPDAALAALTGTSGDPDAPAPSATRQRRVNLWPTLLFLIAMALLAETVLGTRRSVLVQLWRAVTRQPAESV
jgi:hypothetical protein